MGVDISQVCTKCQALFSVKINKNIIVISRIGQESGKDYWKGMTFKEKKFKYSDWYPQGSV